ncbi:MAG: anion permease, partial [Sphingomonadales bacterium]|nr:anion permease [Sphingomonadales bacterium]
MFGIDLSQTTEAWVAIAILLGMLALFVRETYPVEVVAIGGAIAMLVLGILPQDDALKSLSNHAPWTIAAMFIIVGGLVRTGALDWVTQLAARNVEQRPVATLALLSVAILGMSAFVNNTPIVVVMIPIFMQLAKQMQMSPSKVMIPLSYLAIFGGTITLLGTSTNLLVDGVVRQQGLQPFGVFDITPLGIAMSLTGLVYLALFARRALPDRDSMSMLMSDKSKMKFFTEVAIPEDSALI